MIRNIQISRRQAMAGLAKATASMSVTGENGGAKLDHGGGGEVLLRAA